MGKKIIDYFDDNYLIIHKRIGNDGADSWQRTGTYYMASRIYFSENLPLPECMKDAPRLEPTLLAAVRATQVKPGIWIRNPESNADWHKDPKQFSRDQQTALVMALSEWRNESRDLYQALEDTEKAHRDRWFLGYKYQNWDFATPEHMNFYNRGFNRERNYMLGDLFMANDSISLCHASRGGEDGDWVGKCLNHTLALIQAKRRKPTPRSNWAAEYFAKNLWAVKGFEYMHPILAAWKCYFKDIGDPPLDEVMAPVIKRYLL